MLLRRSLLLAALAIGGACGEGEARDGGTDAGRDAGADAGRDAGRDAGLRDAGSDAGRDAGNADPAWEPLPGLPDGCVIERAVDPSSHLQWAWEPCGATTGCERALPSRSGVMFFGVGHAAEAVWVSGGFEDAGHQYTFHASLDGAVVGAWRGPTGRAQALADTVCSVGPIGVGGGVGAFSAIYFSTVIGRTFFYRGRVEQLGEVVEPIGVFDTGSAPPTTLAVSDSLLVGEMSGAAYLLAWRGTDRRALFSPEVDGIPLHVGVIGDHAIWEDWGDVPRLAHATFDTPAAIYYDASPARAHGWGTDGSQLAWLQSTRDTSGVRASLELWAARYERDPAALVPRRVRTLDLRIRRGIVGDGMYAVIRVDLTPRRYELYDLSDGRRRAYVPPPELPGSQDPLYVDSTMLLHRSGTAAEGAFLVRIDPTTLPYDP